MIKRNLVFALVASLLAAGFASPVMARSCMDLWYERNLIFAQNGYCFSTSLGQRQFAEFECWTKSPTLTPREQKRVDAIRAEERRRGCKVN